MIKAAFNQSKVSCFAYGQTGSGKTFTMMGDYSNNKYIPGLYLLSANEVFNLLDQPEYASFEIYVSFYEIYCNKLFDLLNNKNVLQAREDGKGNIVIVGLVEKNISNLNELMAVIDFGLRSRTTGVTGANNDSSRSHAIMQINIMDGKNVHGKISFIDLAGSERAVDTIDTNKQTKIDGAEINKSLLALKECIRALDQEKRHTPFRCSKLTLVLRDSFIGNCMTLMIANISPCLSCSEHTLNTLRYADRVKELRKPKSEKEGKDVYEQLNNLLMMPRQHNKTLKYNIDIKKNRGSDRGASNYMNNMGSNNNEDNTGYAGGIMHINQIIKESNIKTKKQLNKNSNISTGSSNQPTNNNYNKRKTSHSPDRNNPNYPNSNNAYQNNIMKDNNQQKIKKESNNNQKLFPQSKSEIWKPNNNLQKRNANEEDVENYVSKYSNLNIENDREYKKYQETHEELINNILKEEDTFISLHRQHVDDMVDSIKEQMMYLNEVDKPGSDLMMYTSVVDKILLEQINKMKHLRERLSKFRIMLKDEEALSLIIQDDVDFNPELEYNNKNNKENI